MSSIPYNYGSYIDAKVSMTDTGHVSAGKQIQSPASAGSRGLAKTTQFTNDRTQMQMGNSPIAESMIEIRSILNRIDGVNAPVQEDAGEKIANMAQNMTKDQFMSHADELGLTPEEAAEHYEKMQGGAHVQEDDMRDMTISDLEAQLGKINDEITFLQIDQKDKESALAALGELRSVLDKYQSQQESADSGEMSRLKELSGIEEDTSDDIMQWAKKYSQYKNLEDDNLIEALYDYAFELGITQLIFEVGELQAAERELGKKQEDWEDKEINAAMEMSPISNGLLDDLHRILPGNAELEQKLDSIRGMLEKAGLKEDKYQPMPEGDEFNIEEDEDFEEVLGPLGFPEDETELFDAEYRGRKVPLNKPMRGDVKKFKVYVKDPKSGNVKKVNFGHGGTSAKRKTMRIRKSNPKARKSFRARHNCANPGPKTKARYWSCRKW
jgi:hypothetical protein